VAIGRGQQVDQIQQFGVVVGHGQATHAAAPVVELRLNLVALVGVEHRPQAIQPLFAMLLQRPASDALDVVVLARGRLDLVAADLAIQGVQLGRLRRPGKGRAVGCGQQGCDRREEQDVAPQAVVSW
jgi:hypothetical protein